MAVCRVRLTLERLVIVHPFGRVQRPCQPRNSWDRWAWRSATVHRTDPKSARQLLSPWGLEARLSVIGLGVALFLVVILMLLLSHYYTV